MAKKERIRNCENAPQFIDYGKTLDQFEKGTLPLARFNSNRNQSWEMSEVSSSVE